MQIDIKPEAKIKKSSVCSLLEIKVTLNVKAVSKEDGQCLEIICKQLERNSDIPNLLATIGDFENMMVMNHLDSLSEKS